MQNYAYITPTVQSTDPRMVKAIDGWLGLYEACYVMKKLFDEGRVDKTKKDPPGFGISSTERPLPDHLLAALMSGAKALNEWNGYWVLGGGLAMNFHGRERATRDVDFFLLEDETRLAPVLEALSRHGLRPHTLERPSFTPPTALFWWVPLQFGLPTAALVDVDLLVAPHEFMAFLHSTGTESEVNGVRVRVIGLEAFIILKLLAFRGQDQTDIQKTLKASKNLDRELIRAWAEKFKIEDHFVEMERQDRANDGRRWG